MADARSCSTFRATIQMRARDHQDARCDIAFRADTNGGVATDNQHFMTHKSICAYGNRPTRPDAHTGDQPGGG